MRCLFIADAAGAEDIYFWGFRTPNTYAVMFETPLATAAPRQGKLPGHFPYQEGQNYDKFWE